MAACSKKGSKQEVREFGAAAKQLLELADWLRTGGCKMAAMKSLPPIWKPLYNILGSSDMNAIVVNARHMKAVPGRKTDVIVWNGPPSLISTDCSSQAISRIRTSVS